MSETKKVTHKKDSLAPALAISAALHLVLVIALLVGADFGKTATPTPKAGSTIDATVIDPAVVNAQAQKIRQQRAQAKQEEAERLKRLEQQAQRLEQQREQEEQRLREVKRQKLEAERQAREEKKRLAEQKAQAEEQARIAREKAQQAERERQRKLEEKRQAELAAEQAEKARQQKLAEQRKAEEAAKKAEAERQRKLAERKKAEEEARKAEQARQEAERKAEEAKRRQQEQEAALNDLFSGLESEASQRQSARGQFIQDEVARYGAIFTQMIQQRLLVDDGLTGQECVVNMRLSPTGLLLDVKEKAGNTRLCRATKTAVVSVSQFPMPDDGDIIAKLREIELTVRPN
ncbi:cell envelope integrity protein TolA [Salinivibrio sp. IB872]|uniref:cell envelope integrity protein TolA n=1 Tax=Salinivibrio sp. IB872 TaxID=1766123 RepID=UPI000986CFDA|nr:cell envelope integrity protein TolA [Salinivibrio sp. IB872]OOF28622.1 protein TolA [Salinivibrio sp. IB872]